MTDASWRTPRPRATLFQMNSGDSGAHNRYSREDRQSSMRSSGRSLDASTLRSFEYNRHRFAEDDRMQSIQRRNRQSIHEVLPLLDALFMAIFCDCDSSLERSLLMTLSHVSFTLLGSNSSHIGWMSDDHRPPSC